MAHKPSQKFRAVEVRVALTGGLSRVQPRISVPLISDFSIKFLPQAVEFQVQVGALACGQLRGEIQDFLFAHFVELYNLFVSANWRKKATGRIYMSKRDELIAKYADDLKSKCGMTPDMDLLTKVTIGCGPSIYNADASTVAGSQPSELETVKKNFLMKKLGLADGPELMDAINSVIETYGRSERNKYRAVVYYMLVKHFGKEAVYG